MTDDAAAAVEEVQADAEAALADQVAWHAIIEQRRLQQFLDTYAALVHEVELVVSADGVYGEAVDPGNVAMAEQTLTPRGFETFELPVEQRITIGISVDKLDEYVGKTNADEPVELAYNEETQKLEITLPNATFEMACIDPDSIRETDGVNRDFLEDTVADVEVPGAALAHAVDVVGMVSDHVRVTCDPDADAPLTFSAEGDTDTAEVGFADSLAEGSTVDAAAESLFSHEYLANIVGAVPDDASVRCRYGNEWPSLYEFEYADGAAEVAMMLAPRIQSR